METVQVLRGFAIVVCDRGFVYVGDIEYTEQFCLVKNAYNIRYWGTERGLGELALEGNKEKTKLDKVGTVRVPSKAIINIIDTEVKLWKF